ncbi:MAG: hypothetical protein QME41_01650, partial [Actinomycetota bacterium]|nr:hypothetical protein [Actinomycetota bacterium]
MSSIDFQKFLLLATNMQDKPLFEFTPYKYGCFSFTSYCDKRALTRDGIIKNDDGWINSDCVDYYAQLTTIDQSILRKVKREYGQLSGNNLISLVYQKFPYYTINSEIASNFIDEDSIKRNKQIYLSQTNSAVFSIGYEG